jgi:uncharacterized protein YndB with AHSA1/START domain
MSMGGNEQDTNEVYATRELAASVEQAWLAWSDPDYVRRWWGPQGFSCPRADLDFRVGGTTRVTMQAPEAYGGMWLHNGWTYRTITEPTLIEFVLTFTDEEGQVLDPAAIGIEGGVPREVPHRVEITPLGADRSRVTVTETGYTTDLAREQSQPGLEQCLDKMQAIFATPNEHGQRD